MPADLRKRYAEALAATCKLHEINGVCIACDRRLAAVMAVRDGELRELREQVAFEKHRASTYLADYNFLDFQSRAQARELAALKTEGARDACPPAPRPLPRP